MLMWVWLETTTKPLLVDLKNGKAMLKQKPISYDKASETMSGASWFSLYIQRADVLLHYGS